MTVMYAITKVITFCYGHRLLQYEGKCNRLHGHNARVELELSATQLDRLGMVRDFTDVKRAIQGWIDATLDHTLILHRDDPVVPSLQALKEPILLLEDNPTAERLARLIFEQADRLGLPVSAVRFWETESSFATYRPGAPVR